MDVNGLFEVDKPDPKRDCDIVQENQETSSPKDSERDSKGKKENNYLVKKSARQRYLCGQENCTADLCLQDSREGELHKEAKDSRKYV
jgi:hypothetical protein